MLAFQMMFGCQLNFAAQKHAVILEVLMRYGVVLMHIFFDDDAVEKLFWV